MPIMQRLKLRARRFGDETSGSIPVEGLLVSTLLIWWYVAAFTFFYAYQQKNANLKGAYTIADMLSRQTDAIDEDYITGLNTVFDYMTRSPRDTFIRVSSLYWDDVQDRYEVQWSHVTDPAYNHHTYSSIQPLAAKIPTMPEQDSVILVETFMYHQPIFNVGLGPAWYTTFITTRPRFASCVPWAPTGGNCSFHDSTYAGNDGSDGDANDDFDDDDDDYETPVN